MAEFGRLIDRDRAQMKQYLSETYNEGRSIGEKVARHIEGKLGLAYGSLDNVDAQALDETVPANAPPWPFKRITPSQWAKLSAEDRANAEGYIAALLPAADQKRRA